MSENTASDSMRFTLVHHPVEPLPAPDSAQQRALTIAEHSSLVVRGAPGSGRTTTALLMFRQAVAHGQVAQLWVPDRVRVDLLARQVQALAPHAVRAVRTPLAWAFAIVNTWRTNRPDPLGPLELITGAAEDAELEQLLASVPAPWPPSLGEHMRSMPAFRMEVRNLFARCGEAGLSAAGLRHLGERHERPEWVAAAQILQQWQDSAAHSPQFRGTMLAGIATLQTTAALLLQRWPDDVESGLVSADAPVPDLVIVDDMQDMNIATNTLVQALAASGARVAVFADPDVATSGYRGGEPHLDGLLEEQLGAVHVELGDVYCGGPRLRGLTQALTQTVPSNGPIGRRKVGARGSQASESISVHVAASVHQLGALIARDIRSQHVHQGLAYDDQAVVVRSQSEVSVLQRSLERAGIPLNRSSSVHTFSAEPVARILLQLLLAPDRSNGPEPAADFEQQVAHNLLESVMVGVDGLDVHRVAQLLGPDVSGAAHILEQPDAVRDVFNRDDAPPLAPDFATAFERAVRIWQARSSVHRSAHLGPQAALWQLWDSAQVAEQWRAGAVAPTPLRSLGGPRDNAWFDQQLDSVMALFRVADVWEQRNPAGTTSQFAAQLLEENVASDTLATPGIRPPGVWVVTPAQALGRSWDSVWVAGLQDGLWPNLRLRDRTLRSDLVIPAARGQLNEQVALDTRTARRATQDDDMRLLIAAVTRSRGRLSVGAVSNDDQAPSRFLLQIRPWADDVGQGGADTVGGARGADGAIGTGKTGVLAETGRTGEASESGQSDGDSTTNTHIAAETDLPALVLEQVRPPLDLEGQAGSLRHVAAAGLLPTASDEEKQLQPVASAIIAVMALEGVAAAQPAWWCGAGGLTSTSAVTVSGPVTVASSSIETALACPLRWFLEQRAGARALSTGPATLGSLIHSIAQDLPFGTLPQLEAAFEERFKELELEAGSIEEEQTRQVGQTLVRGLADYIASVHTTPAQVEVPFTVELGDVRLSGRIDRIEQVDGGVRITDFKTGTTKVSEEQAVENPQLAAYQIAQLSQGHTVVGARLVYPRFAMKKKQQLFDERVQPGLDADQREQWIWTLNQAASQLRGPSYQAYPSGPWKQPCRTCSFQRVCPAFVSAQRTIE